VKLGRYDEAEAAYREAVLLDPDEPAPLYNLACLAALQGRVRDAVAPLRMAIAMNPAFRDAARSDPDFDRIRADEPFREVVNEAPAAGSPS
jgi:Flp pilus assembly protein TadD